MILENPMFDNEFHISTDKQASLVSVVCSKFQAHSTNEMTTQSLLELRELLRTLGIKAGNEYIQNKKNLESGTVLGIGKLKEIAEEAKAEDSSLLVFDFELTAGQMKNIKKITNMAVVDRCHVILEIFAKHARTKEAKIQIEISRLKYILPRLAGFWGHFSRQKGGVGIMGGEGEQQIELDRRLVRERIESYKKKLKAIVKSREQQRKKRQNKAVTAALVGYTNAGKSSIMNRLCDVNILEEDKLFATLDSTYRTLNPDTKPNMILIDTVGFISNLPNTLVEGFKTTLESAMEADLLVIVCDISDPACEKHIDVTKQVLIELGIKGKDQVIVFNKNDKITDPHRAKIIRKKYPNSFLVSSFNQNDMTSLREHIINYFLNKQNYYDLFIPYQHGSLHGKIIGQTNVLGQSNHELGIFYRIRVPEFIFNTLGVHDFILAPDDPILKEFSEIS